MKHNPRWWGIYSVDMFNIKVNDPKNTILTSNLPLGKSTMTCNMSPGEDGKPWRH